jgi:23S rRNA (pseudouridine1915-N3)-methyltransferase
MKFIICTVGHKMPLWVEAAFQEYAKRMPREAAIELIEIKPEKRGSGKTADKSRSAEGTRIRAAIPPGCRVVAMDERGSHWTTVMLTDSITKWMKNGGDTAFLIGGADGLDPGLRNSADEVFALSALTLPHAFVRILLAEQLYRAVSLIKGHPYHRA